MRVRNTHTHTRAVKNREQSAQAASGKRHCALIAIIRLERARRAFYRARNEREKKETTRRRRAYFTLGALLCTRAVSFVVRRGETNYIGKIGRAL